MPGSEIDPLALPPFPLEVVTRRLEHELAALKKRIHLLEGFEKVFDALDEIIRRSGSRTAADAAEKIMKRSSSTPSRRTRSWS
jgi:DNA gyrase/topoisomerase IV subunit A